MIEDTELPERMDVATVSDGVLTQLVADIERKHDLTADEWERVGAMRSRFRDTAGSSASRLEAAYLRSVLHDVDHWRKTAATPGPTVSATRCLHTVGQGRSTVACRGMVSWVRSGGWLVGRCGECGREYAR